MPAIPKVPSLSRQIEALEATVLQKKNTQNANPFLVDQPTKKKGTKDPLAASTLFEMASEMRLNTIDDFYGHSDSDDEENGDMESVEYDNDDEKVDRAETASLGSNYIFRKNNFHYYRKAGLDKQKKAKLIKRAKQIMLVKCIFMVCMLTMMSGIFLHHVRRNNGVGKGADFIPASEVEAIQHHQKKHLFHHEDKDGEESNEMEEEFKKDDGDDAQLISSILPEGWRQYTDKESGRIYYSDPKGQVTWQRPSIHEDHSLLLLSNSTESTNEADSSSRSNSNAYHDDKAGASFVVTLPEGWEQFKDPITGRPYYTKGRDPTIFWELPNYGGNKTVENGNIDDDLQSSTIDDENNEIVIIDSNDKNSDGSTLPDEGATDTVSSERNESTNTLIHGEQSNFTSDTFPFVSQESASTEMDDGNEQPDSQASMSSTNDVSSDLTSKPVYSILKSSSSSEGISRSDEESSSADDDYDEADDEDEDEDEDDEDDNDEDVGNVVVEAEAHEDEDEDNVSTED